MVVLDCSVRVVLGEQLDNGSDCLAFAFVRRASQSKELFQSGPPLLLAQAAKLSRD